MIALSQLDKHAVLARGQVRKGESTTDRHAEIFWHQEAVGVGPSRYSALERSPSSARTSILLIKSAAIDVTKTRIFPSLAN